MINRGDLQRETAWERACLGGCELLRAADWAAEVGGGDVEEEVPGHLGGAG